MSTHACAGGALPGSRQEDQAGELAAFLARHGRVLALTGAGISTASGIPDYRDRDGIRRGKAPVQGPDFRSQEAVRKRYWARSMAGWPLLSQARPNAGHRALAQLQAAGRLAAFITQNVDGLHQRAGCEGVLELHGNIHVVACHGCGATFPRDAIQSVLEIANPGLAGAMAKPAPDGDAHLEPESLAAFCLPQCAHCAGMLMPGVVFFGDGVPRPCAEEAERRIAQADAVLVAGSSLMVHSAYRLVRAAAEAGKPVAAVNLGKTRADPLLSLKIEARCEHALPALCRLLGLVIPAWEPAPPSAAQASNASS